MLGRELYSFRNGEKLRLPCLCEAKKGDQVLGSGGPYHCTIMYQHIATGKQIIDSKSSTTFSELRLLGFQAAFQRISA